jgi:RNA polymerase sigma-70 factor (ECF subfamily)
MIDALKERPALAVGSQVRPVAGVPTFTTPRWSAMEHAGDFDRERSPADLDELCQTYWRPLYVFARYKGNDPDTAQDITQAFFADFLARNRITRADRKSGCFRSFLVASMKNFMRNELRRATAQKRGGGRRAVSLDAMTIVEAGMDNWAAAESPSLACDRAWASALLDKIIGDLQMEWDRDGRGSLFREFLPHLWGDATSVPYAELCARFDLTPVNLRVSFHRLRQRYRELLRRAVAETVISETEVEEEIRFLMRVVSR